MQTKNRMDMSPPGIVLNVSSPSKLRLTGYPYLSTDLIPFPTRLTTLLNVKRVFLFYFLSISIYL